MSSSPTTNHDCNDLLRNYRKLVREEQKKDLFLKGYGRRANERFTTVVGIAFAAGACVGVTAGVMRALATSDKTPKLMLNKLLNMASNRGIAFGTKTAVIGGYMYLTQSTLNWSLGNHKWWHPVLAGTAAGCFYEICHPWRVAARSALIAGSVAGLTNYAIRDNNGTNPNSTITTLSHSN